MVPSCCSIPNRVHEDPAFGDRARRRAESRLRSAIAAVGERLVLDPVRQVLASYGQAHAALQDTTAWP